MTNSDIMRARAKRLSDEAQKIDDPGKRLAQVLKAVELAAEADALARDQGTLAAPYMVDGQPSGGTRENA